MSKNIIVKWVPEDAFGYGYAMRVVVSDHDRFSPNTRFDFGYFKVARDEGFTIISLPPDKEEL